MVKRKRSFQWLLTVCFSILLLYAPVGASILFQDDLESNTTVSTSVYPDINGDYDPDNSPVGAWLAEENGAEMLQVSSYTLENDPHQPPAAHSGSNYVISGYDAVTYGNENHYGFATATFTATAGVVIDFWFFGSQDPNRPTHYQVATYDGNFDKTALLLSMNDAAPGRIAYVSGGWKDAVSTWTPGVWNHVMVQVSCSDGTAYLKVNDQPREAIGLYSTTAANVGYVRFYGDQRCFYDDILITDVGKAYLTVEAVPSFVTAVTPAAGTHEYDMNVEASLSAGRYAACPNVYVFDYWEGDVADMNAANTTVTMDTNKTVKAHFKINNVCGDECHAYPASDLNQDCYVTLEDFAIISAAWLHCTAPECD